MISYLIDKYSLTNLLMVFIQFIIPTIIYIISFMYVSDEQNDWYDTLKLSKNTFIKGKKIIFLGCIVFLFSGIANIVILDYYYKNNPGNDHKSIEHIYKNSKPSNQSLHFYLFPLMILSSSIGFIIAYQFHSFLIHIILMVVSIVFNIYLIIFYMKHISYVISLFLTPLLLWQIANIFYYYPTLCDDNCRNETKT